LVWTQKYAPKSLKEFVDQKEALEKFLSWVKKWKPEKALLFYGIPGTGKTALVQAYTSEKNLEFIEMNASDFRSAKKIQEVLGQSMLQTPLFKKGKIFLIDEIEGLAGREDFGGVGAIIQIIKKSRFPIVLTSNNPWSSKLRSLRNYCTLIQFKKIPVHQIEKRLKEICKKEKIKTDKEVLRKLAKTSKGDLRAAINDLESVSQGKNKISLKDLETLDYREKEISIFDALKIIFKTQTALTAKSAIRNVDKNPEEVFWWIENNIAREYEKPEEIAKAFEILSKADLFRQRVSSRQNWKLKGYMIDLMTSGVARAKKEMYRKFTRYKYPSKIIVLGRTKIERKEEKEKLLELSKQLHCSTRKIRKEFLPYLNIIEKNKK
jgi:replication factor C large subunit